MADVFVKVVHRKVQAPSADGGWFIVTDDAQEDILAGVFDSEQEAIDSVESLGCKLKMEKSKVQSIKIKQLKPADLFRVGPFWYRLLKAGKDCEVSRIGGGTETISGNTIVDELSVLSRS